jgi:putative ABC transport system permease protein
MRRIDILRRAGKNIRRAKVRTILTALAIAVGATTIALAIAAGKGGTAYVDNLAGKIGDQNSLTIVRARKEVKNPDAPQKIEGSVEETNEKNLKESIKNSSFSEKDVQQIKNLKGVREASPMFGVSAESVRMNSDKYFVSIKTKYNEQPIELSAGKLAENNQVPSGKIVAPKAFVETFGGKTPSDLLGKKVTFEFKNDKGEIFEREFEIIAVDNGKTDMSFGYENDFVMNNSDGVEIKKAQTTEEIQYYSITANIDGSKSVDQLKSEIKSLNGGEFYEVYTFADDKATVQTAINVMAAGLAGFGALTLLASVFGIINTQYISVLERTSQIGLMKSLGMRKSEVSKLFRYEAALIGLFGGLIGVTVAYGFTFLNPVINEFFRSSGGRGVDVNLLQPDFMAWGLLIIGLMIISILSGFFPARKAAKMNPIEALRTE